MLLGAAACTCDFPAEQRGSQRTKRAMAGSGVFGGGAGATAETCLEQGK